MVYCFMKSFAHLNLQFIASNVFKHAMLGSWNANMKLRQYIFYLSQAGVGKRLLSASLPCKLVTAPKEFISPGNSLLAAC